ncbi:hypothetical protein QQ045_017307 [Rhodiola kirilowii]
MLGCPRRRRPSASEHSTTAEGGPAIGIDIGTKYSRVGVWRNGCIEILPNELGSRHTPSCVAFTDSDILIGNAAMNQAAANPSNTIFEPVIGIDLGTKYSRVGVWQNGRVVILPNEQGSRSTPSCVAFTDSEILTGNAALNQAAVNPFNTIFGLNLTCDGLVLSKWKRVHCFAMEKEIENTEAQLVRDDTAGVGAGVRSFREKDEDEFRSSEVLIMN